MRLANYLGIEFAKSGDAELIYGAIDPEGGPSIAELAALIAPPARGGDTLAASLEVMRLMQPEGSA